MCEPAITNPTATSVNAQQDSEGGRYVFPQDIKSSVFDASQRTILERIASNASLVEILENIVALVEEKAASHQVDLLCTVLLLDAQRGTLHHGASSLLPEGYRQAIDGSTIGPNAGSCGAAAFLRQRVIVADISTHPNWDAYRTHAEKAQLRACWSTPIVSHQQAVLGTFAIYYRIPRGPTIEEIGWVDVAVHLAAVAITNEHMKSALSISEARYRQIVDTAYEGVWQIDTAGNPLLVNQRMADMLGYTLAELKNLNMYDLTPQSDWENASHYLKARLAHISAQYDWRFVRKDGQHFWCIVAATPTYDDQGNVSGALGMVTDINERKQVEARVRRLSRLYAVSSSVNEAIVRVRDPQELYRQACHIAVEQGEVSLAWIAVRNSANDELRLVSSCGGNEDFMQRVIERIRSEPKLPGPAGRALREGVVAVTNDIGAEENFFWKEEALHLGLRSCAVLPLSIEATTVGLMAIYADQIGYFSDEELRVLTALAADISFAVESSIKEQARQQASDALRESERMISVLFANLPGMAYRCRNNPYWTAEIVSPGCRELTGYAPEDLMNNRVKSYADVIYPADREEVANKVQTGINNKQSFEVVYRIITANGAIKWVLERGSGIFDECGDLRFLEGFVTDITARREAEEQIAAQAALLDKAKDAIMLCGLNDVVFYWNKGAELLYGWTALQAIGQKTTQLMSGETEQRRQVMAILLEQGEWSGEMTQFTKLGHEIIIDGSWTLVRDDLGKPRSILKINTDITKRKKLESQFLNTQRLESIGTLAGGIAHDFNNILTAITGNAKLAQIDLPTEHPLRTPLREIEKASLRASDLVRQILTFSRRQEVRREVIQLHSIIAESLRLLRATLPAQIVIHSRLDPSTPEVAADATQIHQLMINLGTNAAYAMREQGGVLTVEFEEIKLDKELSSSSSKDITIVVPPGYYARLTVGDTGGGMDHETLTRIFEPFFTTKSTGQGTGLGLSVVHGIVKSHEGGATVHSELQVGTTFCLYFPAIKSKSIKNSHGDDSLNQEPPNAMASSTPPLGHGQRILYVDDEEALVFLTTRVLERLGYQVTGRTDAKQALAEFKADPMKFDAVVSDLSMPGMTGPDLAREVLALRPDIPIVLTSGYIRDEDMKAVRKLGIRDLVLKPNTVEDLGETLHRLLTRN